MLPEINNTDKEESKETPSDLKEQANQREPKKGYNEHNPAQEGGAFEPDTKDDKTSDEPPKAEDL